MRLLVFFKWDNLPTFAYNIQDFVVDDDDSFDTCYLAHHQVTRFREGYTHKLLSYWLYLNIFSWLQDNGDCKNMNDVVCGSCQMVLPSYSIASIRFNILKTWAGHVNAICIPLDHCPSHSVFISFSQLNQVRWRLSTMLAVQ